MNLILRISSLISIFIMLVVANMEAQSNQYLHFDKIDDFVEVPAASQYIAGADGVTLTGWFYCDALGYGQGMFGFRNGGTGSGELYMIQLGSGRLENRFITSGGLSEIQSPDNTVKEGVWQHFAFVWSGQDLKLYIDGVLDDTAPSNSVPFASEDTPFAIGKLISPFDFIFGGRIDEVSLWSKALDQDDITSMIENELEGDEEQLELYFKFNQGAPGGDNKSITTLINEVGNGERDGILKNFALEGESSNFLGELDNTFQVIAFNTLEDKLINSEPFELEASTNSGLEVTFEIVSGPASIEGSLVTLTGETGEVVVKASQPGNDVFDAAMDVNMTFQVLDPATFTPDIEARSPIDNSTIFASALKPIMLAALSDIGSPNLFNVERLTFEVDGQVLEAKSYDNGHYTAWWEPTAYGDYEMKIVSENNFGSSTIETVNITVTADAEDMLVNAATKVHVSADIPTATVTATLPTYLGAFDNIMGYLTITCPDGGCDPWDRISRIEVKDHTGKWHEIIKYLTPYGIPCNHDEDMTSFRSFLYGKVDFRFSIGTQGNGFEYTLDLDYSAGEVDQLYSRIERSWNGSYNFGDLANLQPYENLDITFDKNVERAELVFVGTGHGWGDNNTGNAAEFHRDTHHVMVDGEEAYAHDNWLDCDPNPEGCNNQNGTWYFNRAGWCPGTIAPWQHFDLTPYIDRENIDLHYRLNEAYVDYCHPNNPDCIDGVTCGNCGDGFNPYLSTASYVVKYSNEPIEAITNVETVVYNSIKLSPNPTRGMIQLEVENDIRIQKISILSSTGRSIREMNVDSIGTVLVIDLGELTPGVYFLNAMTDIGVVTKKIVKQ